MSDSSEEEDLSRFKEAVDTSFSKLIHNARKQPLNGNASEDSAKPKSERYLEVASHYNDVKVPEQLQKQIGAKISAIINKNIEFVDVSEKSEKKRRKIKGGVKLFKDSPDYLTSEAAEDTYTEVHNRESKKIKKKRRKIDSDDIDLDENEKINAAAITGDYIISKEDTKCWKSRRKEKLFKYKSQGKGKMLVSAD